MRDIIEKIDWLTAGGAIFLAMVGMVVMSITPAAPSGMVGRQILFLVFGVLVMLGARFLNFEALRLNTPALMFWYVAMVALLAGVLFFGTEVRGSRSWFSFPPFTVQPSEFAKIIGILLLAKYFSYRHAELYRVWHILGSVFYMAVLVVLVALEPDFGTALLMMLTWLGLVVVAGLPLRRLLAVLGVLAIAATTLWVFVLVPYQQERVLSFLSPTRDPLGAGYNQKQALIAIGSGGLIGQGLSGAYQTKLGFLPEAHTDFIFAASGEVFGAVGLVVIMGVLALILWRLMAFAFLTHDNALVPPSNFGRLFAVGLAILILVESGINMGMNLGLLPVTGVPLPFMSSGGSHLLAFFLGLGVYQSFYSRTR